MRPPRRPRRAAGTAGAAPDFLIGSAA